MVYDSQDEVLRNTAALHSSFLDYSVESQLSCHETPKPPYVEAQVAMGVKHLESKPSSPRDFLQTTLAPAGILAEFHESAGARTT